jgi:hypothetical protein
MQTKVRQHIQSLKGRKSHYSLKKSEKLYLPDELNVKKLHQMYIEKLLSKFNMTQCNSIGTPIETNFQASDEYITENIPFR